MHLTLCAIEGYFPSKQLSHCPLRQVEPLGVGLVREELTHQPGGVTLLHADVYDACTVTSW